MRIHYNNYLAALVFSEFIFNRVKKIFIIIYFIFQCHFLGPARRPRRREPRRPRQADAALRRRGRRGPLHRPAAPPVPRPRLRESMFILTPN